MTSLYILPVRRILTQNDLDIFTNSSTHQLIVSFVESLNESVKGLTNDAEVETDKVGRTLLAKSAVFNFSRQLNHC